MTQKDINQKISGEKLCLACGLCCTGHFFTYASLLTDELTDAQSLGLQVEQLNKPEERYFSLPCPLWNGKCSVYDSEMKPDVCGTYRCKLLKEVQGQEITLKQALHELKQIKIMIREMDKILPADQNQNFCIRLLPYLDALEKAGIKCDSEEGQALLQAGMDCDSEGRHALLKIGINCDLEEDQILLKTGVLLAQYSLIFGVTQLFTNRRKRNGIFDPRLVNEPIFKPIFSILDEI